MSFVQRFPAPQFTRDSDRQTPNCRCGRIRVVDVHSLIAKRRHLWPSVSHNRWVVKVKGVPSPGSQSICEKLSGIAHTEGSKHSAPFHNRVRRPFC